MNIYDLEQQIEASMAGWRVGMAVGHQPAIKALAAVKTQIDSGFARPVQQMAIAALTGDQSWIEERNRIYQARRDLVIQRPKRADMTLATFATRPPYSPRGPEQEPNLRYPKMDRSATPVTRPGALGGVQ